MRFDSRTARSLAVIACCLAISTHLGGCGGTDEALADPVPTTEIQYQNMNFLNGFNVVATKLGNTILCADLAGDLQVGAGGQINGQVDVMFDDGAQVGVMFSDSNADFSVGMDHVLLGDDNSNTLTLGVVSVPLSTTFEAAFTELEMAGGPNGTSPAAHALAALAVLHSTPVWLGNTQAARLLAKGGFWCKADCAILVVPIAAVLAAGCAAAVAACAAGTVVTIGGVAVPCAFIAAACGGGVFAGTGAAFDAWVQLVWS